MEEVEYVHQEKKANTVPNFERWLEHNSVKVYFRQGMEQCQSCASPEIFPIAQTFTVFLSSLYTHSNPLYEYAPLLSDIALESNHQPLKTAMLEKWNATEHIAAVHLVLVRDWF